MIQSRAGIIHRVLQNSAYGLCTLHAHQPWALYMCERVPMFMFSDHTLLVTIRNSPLFAITDV